MRFEDQRAKLVKELAKSGIRDEKVLRAFTLTPREDFVLPEYQSYAYQNRPLPIAMEQTISQPLMIAIMMQLLELNSDDIILEIGTGSGYQTALLATIVKEVCTVERIEPLSLGAQKAIKNKGYKNVHFRIGDGAQGWEKAYPPYKEFSKIIVSAGAASIPQRLEEQLAEGGLMVIPVGITKLQELNKISKRNGEIIREHSGACSFVPLITDQD
ncbi:MAG: protein-L-isoaspartate(D-aspartate) O-methyltransferase [Candidatus Cloacimonetes bacterium HGW-Cloacimonetes-2]|jgi:protein-L-isoaspartate(D-aspartate) O-methyltransferase|nr:MAG: protein-L-isoaspartate(D-aspartate) O-methyltransferase [Candidatus Cloacimonetes bacterium HGW-Cloacimonetes-2]